jgi:hypothetical protein
MLTLLLGGGYAGAVLLLGQWFGGVGDTPPSWAVADVTLAVAALFQLARHRIQAVVDRRFLCRERHPSRIAERYCAAQENGDRISPTSPTAIAAGSSSPTLPPGSLSVASGSDPSAGRESAALSSMSPSWCRRVGGDSRRGGNAAWCRHLPRGNSPGWRGRREVPSDP